MRGLHLRHLILSNLPLPVVRSDVRNIGKFTNPRRFKPRTELIVEDSGGR